MIITARYLRATGYRRRFRCRPFVGFIVYIVHSLCVCVCVHPNRGILGIQGPLDQLANVRSRQSGIVLPPAPDRYDALAIEPAERCTHQSMDGHLFVNLLLLPSL